MTIGWKAPCALGLLLVGCGQPASLQVLSPSDRYPDLVATPPASVYLKSNAGTTELRFSTTIGNQGPGVLQIRARVEGGVTHAYQEVLDEGGNVLLTKDVGVFEYHPSHHHFHVDNVALFELRSGSPNGPMVGQGKKISACIQDDVQFGSASPPKQYHTCTPTLQGITPGWADVYTSEVPDQFLPVTWLPAGEYYLINTFDPSNKFLDARRENNTAWVKLYLDPAGWRVDRLTESSHFSPNVTGDGQFWRPFWHGV